MKSNTPTDSKRGFTLMETVIAIGVLSVLLTGFLIVFIPAADGIKKSISIQEADRLVAAVEQELVTTRPGALPVVAAPTGFDRARQRIKYSTGQIVSNKEVNSSGRLEHALLAYQYRGNPSNPRSSDGTPSPVTSTSGKAGDGYILVPMMRRKSSPEFLLDLPAVEGPVFLVKTVQMVNVPDSGQYALQPLPAEGKLRGQIYNPAPNSPATPIDDAAAYPDAVIAFAAEFYPSPSKAAGFFSGDAFTNFYDKAVKPSFTRNLAIRR
jgi:prepilin-type N-terminal cleavage/methylation domain-containing protein